MRSRGAGRVVLLSFLTVVGGTWLLNKGPLRGKFNVPGFTGRP